MNCGGTEVYLAKLSCGYQSTDSERQRLDTNGTICWDTVSRDKCSADMLEDNCEMRSLDFERKSGTLSPLSNTLMLGQLPCGIALKL
ncbi:hypothetical protein BgiBS90_002367, partial [Biomphalaria glabrata]